MVLFLFDECVSYRIADELRVMGYEVASVQGELGKGALDGDIIRWCSQNNAVLVTADYKLKKSRQYAKMLKKYGISVVFFRPGKGSGAWKLKEWYQQVFRQIDRLENEFATSRSPKYLRCGSTGKPQSISL